MRDSPGYGVAHRDGNTQGYPMYMRESAPGIDEQRGRESDSGDHDHI